MNSTIRNISFFLVLAFLIFNKAAAQKAIYTTNRGMTIGFGLGAAYQQSDIANSKGAGFDFFLGSYLFKKENAFFSVDWKFRFLTGENRAYDHRINTDGTYSNIHYGFFNYDLELGLALNRLRERTRILLSGFAGLGITHGITSTDLLDAGGNPWDYSGIDPNSGRQQIYGDLLNLSDKEFETKLINKAAVLPTAGIFLGYQFSHSFTLGIEHKINFSLTEQNSSTGIDTDNKVVTDSKRDRNHYTSLGFKWALGGRALRPARRYTGNTVHTPVTRDNYTPVRPDTRQDPVISAPLPVVEITYPSGNTYSTTSGSLGFTARVKNVRGKQDIRLDLNGKNTGFEYNPLYGNVSSELILAEGKNILVITAANEAGSSRDDLTINMTKPGQVALPVVKFTDPASPATVEKNIYSVSAQTRNVKAWQDVTVTVNGTITSNFNFNPDGIVTTNIPLKEGENKVEVRGRNESGTASDLMTITYTKPVKAVLPPCPPPVLKMIEPSQNELQTDTPTFTIRTGAGNISGKDQISITLNDRKITNYNFTGNEIIFTAALNSGLNSCIIAVDNTCGIQSIKYSIFYKPADVVVEKPCLKPVVNFSISAISREDATHEMKGTVSYVENRSDITVTVNDKPYDSFTFVPNTGALTARFRLEPGSYAVRVAVKNDCDRDEYSGQIVVAEEKPCGIRVNPGNSVWEFCLITPSDTITRETLTNRNFRYSGPAVSLYFLPVAGGGDAVVKGKPYTIRPGQYYLFTGNLTVTVSTKNPGSMGQWSVCVIADREPLSGNGNNRPQSPCEGQKDKKKPEKKGEPKDNK